jgi:hypothetical protein
MTRTVASLASLMIAAFTTAGPLGAQYGQHSDRVPPGQRPPAGTCRVWIDGVPPGRQPAPTTCARAERDASAYGRGAHVVYGDRTSSVWPTDRRLQVLPAAEERRYVDAQGRLCTVRTEYKRNGDRKTTTECKARKRFRDAAGRDRYEDGYDDDDGYAGNACADRDYDGRCDDTWGRRYPTTLPEMIDAVIYQRGQRNAELAQWLGGGHYGVWLTDTDRNGRPERVSWLDSAGRLVQQWEDRNRDGRADLVRLYESGRLMRTLGNE